MSHVRQTVIDALLKASGKTLSAEMISSIRAGKDLNFDEVEFDSLTRFETIMHVEEVFSVEIDDDEVMDNPTLSGLIELIEQKRKLD